jgi:hypothetical protein
MDNLTQDFFIKMTALIGEVYNRMEMVLMLPEDCSNEQKLAVLKEIAVSQGNVRTVSDQLSKPFIT